MAVTSGKRTSAPDTASELCNCRCKRPRDKCGCCDESLLDWYAAMEDASGAAEGRTTPRDKVQVEYRPTA